MDKREIFAQAIEIESEDKRLEFLQQACDDDARLQDEILALVNEHFRESNFFLDDHFEVVQTRSMTSNSQSPGAQIGRYKLLQKIGQGGMGEVFMAEQKEPVRRRVALKLIKEGRADKQILVRFEAERQALAMMDHQNIARVLDAGAADDGTPFFVMELVQGEPITQYCDKNKLTPRKDWNCSFRFVKRSSTPTTKGSMSHHELGNQEEADKYREAFDDGMKAEAFQEDPDCKSFAAELRFIFADSK